MTGVAYGQLFELSLNHLRSINVERDGGRGCTEQVPYTVTPIAVSILHQIVDGILDQTKQRAFSITGVYGTGKSAFMLALTELLLDRTGQNPIARQIQRVDSALYTDLKAVHTQVPTFLPVLVSGSRGPILSALRRALVASLSQRMPLGTDLLANLETLSPEDAKGLVALYERAAHEIGGLVLVVDEFGKFLEYAVTRPDQGDVFVLQLLAEAAARSGDRPLVVFTVLHQAFAAYGIHLSQVQREEWTKIQGRFLDLPFNQSHDVLIRLLIEAITKQHGPALDRIRSHVANLAAQCTNLGLKLGALTARETEQLAVEAAPFHPLALFVFGPYFRRLGQNERSLYAFLRSTEPSAFRTFAETTMLSDGNQVPLYSLPQLYDYILDNLGPTLLGSSTGRNWVLAEETLGRIGEGKALDIALIKVIGLISALGSSAGLKADAPTLALALDHPLPTVETRLQHLVKQKLVVYRNFLETYILWEGSDFDLEAVLVEYRSRVDDALSLAELLGRNLPQAPIEAKRHSFENGTLRVFAVRYADLDTLYRSIREDDEQESDGLVLYLLTPTGSVQVDVETNLAPLVHLRTQPLVVIPVPVPSHLHQAALELTRLRLIASEHRELENDRVARREVSERIEQLGSYIQHQLDDLLSPTDHPLECVYIGTPASAVAVRVRNIVGRKALNRFLSELCDDVFNAAPKIRNELINRRHLSSQGAAARRELLGLMLTHGATEKLGIDKAPPHLSMYRSVLEMGRLHAPSQDGRTWLFAPPAVGNDPLHLRPLWEAFEAYLERSTATRRQVSEFWGELRRPPFGLRDGVIPILFLSMILVKTAEVGVYESGNFIADLESHHLERMVKNPEKFEVRYSPLTEARQELFQELGPYIATAQKGQLVPVVRALIRTVSKLPDYSKRTRELSPAAKKVRDALLYAREPDLLLFQEIPTALGLQPLVGHAIEAHAAVAVARALITALRELNMAHGSLLDRLFAKLQVALRLPEVRNEALSKLQDEVDLLPRDGVDLRLKGFIAHLEPPRNPADFGPWMESLGSFVASRPPATWGDDDEVRFDLELQRLADKLRQMRDMAVARGQVRVNPGTEAIWIGLTNHRGEEVQQVLFINPLIQTQSVEVSARVERLLQEMGITDPEEQLALLTLVTQKRLVVSK